MSEESKDMSNSDFYNDYNEYLNSYVKYTQKLVDCYIEYIMSKEKEEMTDSEKLQYKRYIIGNFNAMLSGIKRKAEGSAKRKIFIAAEHIRKVYRLNDLDFLCLIISLETKRNPEFFNKLQKIDNKVQAYVSYEAVMKLFHFAETISEINDYYIKLKRLRKNMCDLCFEFGSTEIDSRLFSYIMSNGEEGINLSCVSKYFPSEDLKLVAREEFAQKVALFMKENKSDKTIYIHMSGQKGIGKRTVVKRISGILKESVIYFDVKTCPRKTEAEFANVALMAFREALIEKGMICIENFDVLLSDEDENRVYINFLLNKSQIFSSKVIILSENGGIYNEISENRTWFDIKLEDLNKEESITIWDYYMKRISNITDVSHTDMANKFSFSPLQIKGTVKEAERLYLWNGKSKLSKKDLAECAYKQVVRKLDDKATLIHAKHDWNQLVLDVNEKTMLKNACDQIRYKHIVYDKWGMGGRVLYGRGLSMLFAGPPGTGKTMAAQVVANELGLDIYKVDLSQIVSKYIGETEKNLGALFNEAKKSNVILFFDETDALFGKRTEVKDSHDKNANVETSYLLQKMEEYDGITIMTTNYLENIDKAFFRRISYVIHFNFPDVDARKKIWKNMYPKEMPLDNGIDFNYLSRQFELSGGSIKNIAITSAFMAARDKSSVKMKHIILAVKYELGKQGKNLIKDDFAEYSYLLD